MCIRDRGFRNVNVDIDVEKNTSSLKLYKTVSFQGEQKYHIFEKDVSNYTRNILTSSDMVRVSNNRYVAYSESLTSFSSCVLYHFCWQQMVEVLYFS